MLIGGVCVDASETNVQGGNHERAQVKHPPFYLVC